MGTAQSAALSPFERVTRRDTPGARQALPPQRPATGRKDPGPHNGTWSPRAPSSEEEGVKNKTWTQVAARTFAGPAWQGAVFPTRAQSSAQRRRETT